MKRITKLNKNKEIKFRVWDKKKKKWVKDMEGYQWGCEFESGLFLMDGRIYGFYYDVDNTAYKHLEDRFVICRWTGREDVNYKEIYEGDMVKFKHKGSTMFGEVKMIEYMWCVQTGDNYYSLNRVAEPEVIGNIFEENKRFVEVK